MKEISLISTPAESHFHKAIKLLLYKYIFENDKSVIKRSLEKYLGNRFADVYFKLDTGKEVVVEVQNSKISVKELIKRTKDYNQKGMYVLWVLYGEGNCVASPKYPTDTKCIKISLAENFLHRMYGGRVYYVNLNIRKNKASLRTSFALHFSKPLNKNKRGFFKTRYDGYYFRDSNFTEIPSWNILCTEFSGYKIARFYDKNLKNVLKKRIVNFYYLKNKKARYDEKRLLKAILKSFKNKYGKYMIYNAIIELVNEKKIDFRRIIIKKIQKKILS